MRGMVLVVMGALLAGCGTAPRRPDLPGADLLVAPELITLERRHYVPVPDNLTAPEPIATGAIAECFAVAAERRAAIERANAKLTSIGAIQGTEITP